MNKTLQISPAMLLGIILTVAPSIGGTIYWVSNLATRLEATENRVGESDTTALLERITVLESRSQFNNDSIKEIYHAVDDLYTDLEDTEKEITAWAERELDKIYDIVNENPLGN